MNRAFELMLTEVHRYEGTVNQFLGDGIMALFGAPIAHEDHAQRAMPRPWEYRKPWRVIRRILRGEEELIFRCDKASTRVCRSRKHWKRSSNGLHSGWRHDQRGSAPPAGRRSWAHHDFRSPIVWWQGIFTPDLSENCPKKGRADPRLGGGSARVARTRLEVEAERGAHSLCGAGSASFGSSLSVLRRPRRPTDRWSLWWGSRGSGSPDCFSNFVEGGMRRPGSRVGRCLLGGRSRFIL